MDSGDYDAVTALTDKAVSLMLGCRIAHIGVNSAGREEASGGGLPLPRLRLRPDGRPRFGVRIGFGDYARRGPREERTYRRRRQQRRTRDVSASAAGACALTRPPSGSARTASPIFVYLEDELLGFAIHLVRND